MSPSSQPPVGSVDIEHLWKRFHSDKAARALRDRLAAFGRSARRSRAPDKYRWVLRDINLHLDAGDSVGLIGANGSGKSTLLKILTGVMYPYAGSLAVHGRVGALLEVRAGLHSDLTGRENIFLYGGLLGLSRREINARFDDIVEFAMLQDAIDRQVKYYSSGMGMRLGFSVAAFLEPDILLVDEALAVGDAFFQQRCLDRIRDLLAQGTSLVLVSHDLAAIESVCRRGVWLKDGVVMTDTDAHTAVGDYRTWLDDLYHGWIDETAGDAVFRQGAIQVIKTEITGSDGSLPRSQRGLLVDMVLDSPKVIEGELCIGVSEGTASPVFLMTEPVTLASGSTRITCTIPHLPLAAGRYYLWMQFNSADRDTRFAWQPTGSFSVVGAGLGPAPIGVMRASAVQVDAEWLVHDT
jgi:ABC-type polysaccharide/polyol phosphate transport system ATPase subunit